MRLFQFATYGKPYLKYFDTKFPDARTASFKKRIRALLAHRYGAPHILQPVFSGSPEVQYTVADDECLQDAWAGENGLKKGKADQILLAQIEEHRTEILYCLSPVIFDSAFVRRLPGCVKKAVCWRAAPVSNADLSAYDLRLCNFPQFIESWEAHGLRAAWFSPSHDPEMDFFSANKDRPIDISFIGSYGRLHRRRNILLQKIAGLSDRYEVRFHLSFSPWISLLNRFPVGVFLDRGLSIPRSLSRVSFSPVFGLETYRLLGNSKIVFNAAIDMAGEYRGNMRCFEAMGCGAIMVSDEGIYPEGILPGIHFETYRDGGEALDKILDILSNYEEKRLLGVRAADNFKSRFSKKNQWELFQKLAGNL